MENNTLLLEWPTGPDYGEWVDGGGTAAWVMYKLKSADFHIDTLERVGQQCGYSRLAGVEMALDAALAALCGAFDATVGGLIEAAASYFTDDDACSQPPWGRIEEFHYSWNKCLERVIPYLRAEELSQDLDELVRDVNAALSDANTEPLGWLKELQRLRNHAIHQNSLARNIHVGVGTAHDGTEWALTVGTRILPDGTKVAGRSEHPVAYLREVNQRLVDLTGPMLDLTEALCPDDPPTGRPAQSVTIHAPAAQARASASNPRLSPE